MAIVSRVKSICSQRKNQDRIPRMRRVFYLTFALVVLMMPLALEGSTKKEAEPFAKERIPAASSLRFNATVITLHTGETLVGALAAVNQEAIILVSRGAEIEIPWQNMRRIVIETERNHGQFLAFMFLVPYVANLFYLRDKHQPLFYANWRQKEKGEIFFAEALFFGLGTGLGFLTSLGSGEAEAVFEFFGNNEENRRNWKRMRNFIIRPDGQKKFHFSVQGGSVFDQIADQAKSVLQDGGYGTGYTIWDYDYGEASDLNLMRKVQLTYSLNPHVEVGAAFMLLGEPTVFRSKQESYLAYYPAGKYYYTNYRHFDVQQSLSATGYYAVGIYKPFFDILPRGLSLNIGLGLGLVKTDFILKIRKEWQSAIMDFHMTRWQFSSLAFAELYVYLSQMFSLGLNADYVSMPSFEAAGSLEAGIPPQKLRGGNASIGLCLGFHF